MDFNLREITKKSKTTQIDSSFKFFIILGILDTIIRPIQPLNGWKVLVVDKVTLRIISAACRMYDIMEEGVTCKRLFSFFFSFLIFEKKKW